MLWNTEIRRRYNREVRQTTTRLLLTQSRDHQAVLADPGTAPAVRD